MSINRRRLLKDHATLHSSPPPDFFLPTPPPPTDDLTTITINLLGPTSTPFESGLFTIVLKLPLTYPSAPPKATFRTKIFHPNVDDRTGDVCVDTLKREWNEKLTLRDVCVVIRCLLVEPNPTSSLNEEAGRLVAEDWASWERRARLWTKIHAGVPEEMREVVDEVRRRDFGEDEEVNGDGKMGKEGEKESEEASKATETTHTATTANSKRPTPKKSAAAKPAKKQKSTSTNTHQRSKSSLAVEAAPSPSQKAEVPGKDKDKGKDKEKTIDAGGNGTEGVDKNEEVENNSSGKENAGTSTPTPSSTAPAPTSRAASPVKQTLPTAPSLPAESSAPILTLTTSTSTAPALASASTPAIVSPKPVTAPQSLTGKKRPSEESVSRENTKVAKTTHHSTTVKSSSTAAAAAHASSASSTKLAKPGTVKPGANVAKGTTITMKKPGAGGSGTTGKGKEVRKGLKRF